MTTTDGRLPLRCSDEVAESLAGGGAVVALETTIISHGLPRPTNLDVAHDIEAAVRAAGAVPATCGVIAGELRVGLDEAELVHFANSQEIYKLSSRDLPLAIARRLDGATTVAATVSMAAAAGVEVMATGGIGGVHRGARDSWDVSADLGALARHRVAVVAAGVKSVLDVPATLEYLETLGVPVVGWRTKRFPGFYLSDSGSPVDWSVEEIEEAAEVFAAQRSLPGAGGLLLANPVAPSEQLDPALHARVLDTALEEMAAAGVQGKGVTPFLLSALAKATGGLNVAVNRSLVVSNAYLAGDLSCALASLGRRAGPS